MKVCVPGKLESKRRTDLEVPCLVTLKVLRQIFLKVDPNIKDLYICYIYFMKIALVILLLTVNVRNLIHAFYFIRQFFGPFLKLS